MSDQDTKSAEDWVPVALPVPDGWSYVDFEDAFELLSTSKIKTPEAQYLPSGSFPIVDQGKSLIGGYTNSRDHLVNEEGSAIVFGDHTRCFKFINFPFAPGADGTKILKPYPHLLPRFAYYGCLSLRLPDRGYSRHYSFLKRARFPVAPLAEQRRIVAKIEELFSEIDKGVESLAAARVQLKAYRQSVIQQAFERRPQCEDRSALEWTHIPIGETSIKIVDCLHSTPRFSASGKYCIDSTWVEDNNIIYDQARYVDEVTYQDRIRRLKPQRGDVLLVREGSKKIGTALALNSDDDFCLGQRMMMFRLKPKIVPQFFAYYIQSAAFKRQYKPMIGGSASPHLNISDIKRMRFPLCPIDEQREIVSFIERQCSVVDDLKRKIVIETQKSHVLRQSILKQAFSGQLVAQDSADEPATVLLVRIRAKREETSMTKRRNNKNGNKETA